MRMISFCFQRKEYVLAFFFLRVFVIEQECRHLKRILDNRGALTLIQWHSYLLLIEG